jgi:hypothetical protein
MAAVVAAVVQEAPVEIQRSPILVERVVMA